MKKDIYVIRRGKLNETSGNFTGFTVDKDKVFLPASQIEDWIGDLIDKEGQLIDGKLIYCLGSTIVYTQVEKDEDGVNVLDAEGNTIPLKDGEGNPLTFSRLDSLYSSVDKKAVFRVFNEKKLSAIEAEASLAESVAELGLTKEQMKFLTRQGAELV